MTANGTLRSRAQQLKEKWPAYGPLLDFYIDVREAQDASRSGFCADCLVPDGSAREENGEVASSSLNDDLVLDAQASRRLFSSLCRVGEAANEYFAGQVQKINEIMSSGALDIDSLIASWNKPRKIEQAAATAGIDARVLSFLVANCARPSIEAARDLYLAGVELETWKKVYCPACGSLPALNVLKGEPVQRCSICTKCGCEWPGDRLACAICGDRGKDTRSYFHAEDEEAYRIDVCDNCRNFVKTIDLTKTDAPDPVLEDLATLHLDVIAVKKGYSRAVPNVWCE
ncbi:MAG: formate dehydrogenase accessory protein FdhE [Anderseniella sp.]